MRAMTRRARMIAVGIATCFGILAVVEPVRGDGGDVLPPQARPRGISLTEAATTVAPFTAALNAGLGVQLEYLEPLPLQVLYVDPETLDFEFEDGGITGVGSNHFTVPTGTMFYVPILNADDTGVDAPSFPTDDAGTVPYFFGRSQFGAEGMTIIVDGQSTEIGSAYLSRLLSFPEGLPSGATRYLTLGVFLTPLTPGTHTIIIRGAFTGAALQERYGLEFFGEEITYTVEVVPGGRP